MKKNTKNYKKIKKYVTGTQSVNPNADPTIQYQANRNGITAKDSGFNNSQQSLLNRDITQQQYSDTANQTVTDFSNKQTSAAGSRAGVQSAISKIPVAGGLIGGAMSIGGGIGDKFNQKSFDQALAGQNNQGTQQASLLLTDTGSKLAAAKSGVDVAEAFIPINGLFGKSSQDKAEEKAVEAKKRQQYANNQITNYGAIDTTQQSAQLKKGSSGIYIKPENKGKFNATKKATGKTTEELTHSSNPITKKRAIFAQNAAKWDKKEDGVESLGGGQQLFRKTYYKPKKKDRKGYNDFPNDIIKNKSIMEKGVREIETEGREPIFSPKKKDGSRDLLYYNPEDPTHKEGGVKAKVVPKSSYKLKSGSTKLVIPEESAIVTANNGKNKEALIAYKNKDYKKLNKVINQMPNDNTKKKALGSSNLNPSDKWALDNDILPNTNLSTSNPSDKWGTNSAFITNLETTPTNNTKTNTKSKLDLSNTANSLVGLTPSLYNLGQGIFSKPQKTNRRYVNNEAIKYQDFSEPNRRAAQEQFRIESDNIRNASGGSGSTFLANQSLASANRFKNISDINNQESARRFGVQNANTELRNQQNQTNLGLANQYDEQDMANRGKKSEYIAKGLEGLSQAAQMSQLNKNRAKSDNVRLNLLGTGNYTIDKDGNITPKAKKGLKNIKYKLKQ